MNDSDAIFSFNGRRPLTSLILVITTIILIILLVVNLNCNILTEATVNTTTSSLITTTSTSSSIETLSSHYSYLANNKSGGGTSGPSLLGSASSIVPDISNTINITSAAVGNVNPATTAPATTASVTISKISSSGNTSDSSAMANSTTSLSAEMVAANGKADGSTTESSNGAENNPCVALSAQDNSNQTKASNETSRYFDIDYASKTFSDSMADKNAISLYHYLNGFKELMKFFNSLGNVFMFVTSDLENKIGLVEGYRNTEKGGCNPAYLTIQSAIEYETKEKLLRDSKRPSGARTILRLHRALEFLSALMLNLSKLEEDSETVPAAREAYSDTLAKHHPWTIRTIASFAMRTLPHKKLLVENVLGKEYTLNQTTTNAKMLDLANVTENLFKVVDKYYEENDLKDLP